MMICTVKFNRKKAAFAVIIAALILIAVILLVSSKESRRAPSAASKVSVNVKNEKGRVDYLKSCGYEVESPPLSESSVLIPRSFSAVFENYNTLQKKQGFDLSQYCGMEVKLYNYKVLNAEDGVRTVASLYIYEGEVIAGDIHSTELDGFIGPLKRDALSNNN